MFQFPGFAPFRVPYLQYGGLPHSDTCGSTCMCQSPQLFAAYHVLPRLWEPRHSPYALVLLIVLFALLMSLIQKFWYARSIPLYYCFSRILCFQYVNELSGSPHPPGPDNGQLMEDDGCCPWWRISESNRWPPACKAGALASWANPPSVNEIPKF